MYLGFSDAIILLGGLVSFLLTVAMGLRLIRKGSLANYFLIIFLINCFISMILKYMQYNDLFEEYPHLLKWHHPLGLLRPVCFYLYIYFLVHNRTRWRFVYWFHFAPAVFVLVYTLPFYILSGSHKLAVSRGIILDPAPTSVWFAWLTAILAILYFVLSVIEWRSLASSSIKALNRKTHVIRWISWMLIAYLVYMLLALMGWMINNHDILYFSYQVISIFLIGVCILLLSQSPLASDITLITKYNHSTLSEREKDELIQKVSMLMTAKERYQNDGLRLKDLALEIGVGEGHLSQVINEREGVSFNEFVNRFRIKRAKEMLVSDIFAQYTIEAIGYEVGFGTRATFYNSFKKMVGITPTEFRKLELEKQKSVN